MHFHFVLTALMMEDIVWDVGRLTLPTNLNYITKRAQYCEVLSNTWSKGTYSAFTSETTSASWNKACSLKVWPNLKVQSITDWEKGEIFQVQHCDRLPQMKQKTHKKENKNCCECQFGRILHVQATIREGKSSATGRCHHTRALLSPSQHISELIID